MPITLVEIRTQTRGKTPQPFTYKGIGKLTERKVTNTKGEETGAVVDDVDPSGSLSDMNDAISLLLPLADNDAAKAKQMALDGVADYFNRAQRKAASPVQEVSTEDELTPLIAANELSSEDETAFRRAVTITHGLMGGDKLELATKTIANFVAQRKAKAEAEKVKTDAEAAKSAA